MKRSLIPVSSFGSAGEVALTPHPVTPRRARTAGRSGAPSDASAVSHSHGISSRHQNHSHLPDSKTHPRSTAAQRFQITGTGASELNESKWLHISMCLSILLRKRNLLAC